VAEDAPGTPTTAIEAPSQRDEAAPAPARAAAPQLPRPFLLGRKVGMMQHFREDGSIVAATVVRAEANVVTQVRTRERDGYTALQLGYGDVGERNLTKPRAGHLKGLSALGTLREFRVGDVSGFERGQEIGVDRFQGGDRVHVTGISKGKGFQGPVHLHHFKRGPKSHGSDHLRRQGSVGAGTTPGRLWKGLRMAAHQGVDRVTVKNLEVLRADAERGLLVIKGAIPGARNGIVIVRKA
jgi:large subunit ribosomal protein L3